MRRRQFISLLGGAAAAWPLAAGAQQDGRMRRIGMLMTAVEDADSQAWLAAFRQAMPRRGWREGVNYRIEERWGDAGADRISAQTREMVLLGPDVILVQGIRSLLPLRQQISTIPIVFVGSADAVAQGLADSMARPGGHITGFTLYEFSVAGKLVELLKEMAPGVTQVMVLYHPDNTSLAGYMPLIRTAAAAFSVTATEAPVSNLAAIERAIETLAGAGGLLLPSDALLRAHRARIVALAERHRLPAISANRVFAEEGLLMSYGVDIIAIFRGAADYVDRILKGEKAAELPVQAPTNFELVLNLKTAKALGLTVPLTLLGRADAVIE
jgi:putative ABC transport system substrate-binding protein